MKRLLTALLIVLLSVGIASAQTWHVANQQTVAWDAVTQTTEGVDLDPAQVSYEVFLCNAVTDPDCNSPVSVDTTDQTQALITLNTEGRYFVGIKAIRTVSGEAVGESAITWSSDAPYDFGLQYYAAPANPGGLRLPD